MLLWKVNLKSYETEISDNAKIEPLQR